jgi:membrane fusion protein (multidrug efflux system)
MTETPGSAAPQAAAAPVPWRNRRLVVLGVIAAVGAIAYGAYWWLVARHFQSTDDAYVNGDLVQITSEVPGSVLSLSADDTQSVQRGQTLLELDPADARVTAANAEAELAWAVREVRRLFATAAQLRAQIADREVGLRRAREDFGRRSDLLREGAVSSEELSHKRDDIAQMQAALGEAREQLGATLAQIDGTTVESHPQVLAAEAAVREAALALRRTRVASPVAGVVARRSVQIGQRVAAGTPLMAVVPLEEVWVDANFKEVQLRDMRVGQRAEVRADLYGRSVRYRGRVVGLAAGSGNAFALLPAQNASGNWIKIVQRLPVRVAIDAQQLRDHPLRVGLSTTVTVDVRDTSGPLIAAQVRGQPIPRQDSLGDDPVVEARIQRIVTDNGGSRAGAGIDSPHGPVGAP